MPCLWDWVGVIVVGTIAVALFQAIAYRDQSRESGRAYRRTAAVTDPADARPRRLHSSDPSGSTRTAPQGPPPRGRFPRT
jgi:hypothetical protein